ncbi:hypothetical protein K438DRAFT_1756608 [Mycena galopus ATCC 62051]|nr:hypothetical protein K438DRAFT_1756608 [Mycena galopus ATCC 62051]
MSLVTLVAPSCYLLRCFSEPPTLLRGAVLFSMLAWRTDLTAFPTPVQQPWPTSDYPPSTFCLPCKYVGLFRSTPVYLRLRKVDSLRLLLSTSADLGLFWYTDVG